MEIAVMAKNCANFNLLKNFFISVDEIFPVSLTERIDIGSYVEKILANAIVLGACIGEEMVGVASFYANDSVTKQSYLTIIAVKPEFSKQGIATLLIREMISILTIKKMCSVVAITDLQNRPARNMYEKNGFILSSEKDNRATYVYTIDTG